MADSIITKQALSQALKELIRNHEFDKISVGNICEVCGMNRKSFYYHFKDKYDLVNWIYYTEFITVIQKNESLTGWDLLDEICLYFYKNRYLYQKTFRINGQNSFTDYFSDIMKSIISADIAFYFQQQDSVEPFAEFYTDAFVVAIKKWLLKKDCMPPKQFSDFLKQCVLGVLQNVSLDQYL